MQIEGSRGSSDTAGKFPGPDDEKLQNNIPEKLRESIGEVAGEVNCTPTPTPVLTIVVCSGDSSTQTTGAAHIPMQSPKEESPKKCYLSSNASFHEQCRVCQQEKEEALIYLGCQCRGGLAKAHRSCIDAWFRTKGSNQCEICQVVAVNVSPPQTRPTTNYWVRRIDPSYRQEERDRGCLNPLWVAFALLIGGLVLDVLMLMALGVTARPVNMIIGVIVVFGLGIAMRVTFELCNGWSLRRPYPPPL